MFQRVVRLQYEDELLVLDFGSGRLWNHDDFMQRVGEYHIAGASTTQHVVLVGEEGTHGYRTGSLVNDSADCLHARCV